MGLGAEGVVRVSAGLMSVLQGFRIRGHGRH